MYIYILFKIIVERMSQTVKEKINAAVFNFDKKLSNVEKNMGISDVIQSISKRYGFSDWSHNLTEKLNWRGRELRRYLQVNPSGLVSRIRTIDTAAVAPTAKSDYSFINSQCEENEY